ncbi:unnamed protein product [Triticum turgidum subsp. durum]|uniref:Uncharacterized protein n=1 Tax=Triticum turgidum subsp. durum TaxID=4567 RepID=A0A9R1B1L7_TRITD|nr:unnamed protein product [Triticum turgidum subsp. durum]
MACTQENAMATDESTGDHRGSRPSSHDMDLSGDDHVPKVPQFPAQNPRVCVCVCNRPPESNEFVARAGAQAVHHHEAAGEVDRGRAQALPGGPAAARPRLAPHISYEERVQFQAEFGFTQVLIQQYKDEWFNKRIKATHQRPKQASEFTANGDVKEGSCTGSATSVLKLFGKKVVVNDSFQKPNTSTGNPQNGGDVGTEASDDTTTQGSRNLPSGGATEGSSWSPWPSSMQQFVYFVPQPDGFATQSAVPWFGTLPGATFYQQAVAPNQHQHQRHRSETADHKFMQREGSWTGSNTGPGSAAHNSDAADSRGRGNSSESDKTLVPRLTKCESSVSVSLQRGFMSYKRCAAESESLRSEAPREETNVGRSDYPSCWFCLSNIIIFAWKLVLPYAQCCWGGTNRASAAAAAAQVRYATERRRSCGALPKRGGGQLRRVTGRRLDTFSENPCHAKVAISTCASRRGASKPAVPVRLCSPTM